MLPVVEAASLFRMAASVHVTLNMGRIMRISAAGAPPPALRRSHIRRNIHIFYVIGFGQTTNAKPLDPGNPKCGLTTDHGQSTNLEY